MYLDKFARHLIGVGGVVIDRNKVLMVRLRYGQDQDKFKIPGGFVEPGETLEEALKREIMEETGLLVEPRGIIGVRSMVREKNGLTDVYILFTCDLQSVDPDALKPQDSEIHEVKWIGISELETELLVNYAREAIRLALSREYMEFDSEYSSRVLNDRPDIKKYGQYW